MKHPALGIIARAIAQQGPTTKVQYCAAADVIHALRDAGYEVCRPVTRGEGSGTPFRGTDTPQGGGVDHVTGGEAAG